MDPEYVINLFDSCWFNYEILKGGSQYLKVNKQSSSSSSEPKFSSLRSILVRSQSEDMTSFNYGSFSPNSVLFTPQLKSIPSGKSDFISTQEQQQVLQKADQTDPKPKEQGSPVADDVIMLQERKKTKKNSKSRRHGMSKSLSELEFEELKGFMDLGFVFSEQDKQDSDLVEIIPGLQRLGEKERERGSDDDDDDDDNDNKSSCSSTSSAARRPYLSEAWEKLDTKSNMKQQKPAMMMNWEIPAVKSEIDMKDNLKLWAHTVASIVK